MSDDDFGDEFDEFHPYDHSPGLGALGAGAAYAFYRHGQDRQTRQLIEGLSERMSRPPAAPVQVDVHVHGEDDEPVHAVNALDYATMDGPDSWDDYIGQEPLKRQLMVRIKGAQARGEALKHTLLASGFPGVGKTAMARLIAKTLGVQIFEIVPPFSIHALVDAAERLNDRDILFIDEIHGLANHGKKGAEILLKVMEDRVAYLPSGEAVELADITIIGATTDRDKLPEPVIDRFKIKPYFQPYSLTELAEIAISFAYRHDCEDVLDDEMAIAIAQACRGTPRIIEEMVLADRDLSLSLGRNATPQEVLEFLEVEPDGMTRTHIHYVTALYQFFSRKTKSEGIEYVVGEAAMQQILRETKQGVGRIERFLIETGLIDRTPRGRRLTRRGIAKAQQFISEGKGARDV